MNNNYNGPKDERLNLTSLVAIIVGSVIGAGVFNLPSDMAKGANSGAVIIGWLITGIGMIALARVYQNLSLRKPDLDGGVYSYAKAGFGEYIGFNSAWGYWLSAWLANVAYATLLFGTLSYFFPIFGEGNNLPSIIGASIFIWSIHTLVLKGVKEAALVNVVTTIAKIIPIFIFVIFAIIAFNYDIMIDDFWGKGAGFNLESVVEQVRSTMLVTLWVFIGIEGAVVVSGRAKRREDVGKATIIALTGTLILYVMISVLSLGIMSRVELSEVPTPSLSYVLEYIVGDWGAAIINIGLVISLLGATLGWTLLASEIPYVAAKDKVLPKFFAKENKNESPVNSLWITNGLIQLFLIITLFAASTYRALYFISGTAILIPYLFSGLYQLKLTITGEAYSKSSKKRIRKDMITGIVSSIYGIWLIYAAGVSYLLLAAILYAPGIFFFWKARKERGLEVFKTYEKYVAIFIVIVSIISIVLLINGEISPL